VEEVSRFSFGVASYHESLRREAEKNSVHNRADPSCDITIMGMCSKIQVPHVLEALHVHVRTRGRYIILTLVSFLVRMLRLEIQHGHLTISALWCNA
jgi:hypothetical protein